ncbi:MAG TPA: prepilin-type N-terminal cleavage/methylation domain-containing protein [Gemmatirosa sp.]
MRRATQPSRARRGFTIVELLVAAVLTAVIIGAALPFIIGQPKVIAAAAVRGDAGQNARFALTTLDRELRMIGTGTLATQPMLVAADPYAITFNADLVTRDSTDIWGVSYDPSVDSTAAIALQPPAVSLPRALGTYPQVPFALADGSPAYAETVSYWVSPDSSSPRPNEYVLFRKVNRLAPVVVTTGIYIKPGDVFFKYVWVRDTTAALDTVPASAFPLRHTAAIHGSAADTGENGRVASQVDRVRVVVVNAAGQYRDPRRNGALGQRTARASTTLINVTALRRNACGTAPDASPATAALSSSGGTPDHVTVSWTAVTDDGAGERDIDRYLIYRSINGGPFTNPIADVPAAGQAGRAYTYVDYDVKRAPVSPQTASSTNSFVYAVVAQDCQPQVATMSPTTALQVPVVP